MAQTMKAAVVHEFKQPLAIEAVPVPEPGPGQILVKIVASGVCHTDLHAADGDWPVKPSPPFIPGHEGVGTVAALGAGVTAVEEGDRVGVPWLHTACGHCKYCLSGWETLCDAQKNTGYAVNGGFAEYVLADPELCRPPAGRSRLRDGGTDPLRRRHRLQGPEGDRHQARRHRGDLRHRRPRPRRRAVREGHGPQGDRRRHLRREAGPRPRDGRGRRDQCAATDPVAEVRKLCGGAEGVLVTAVSPKAFSQALGMLGKRGTMALVGLPPGTFELDIFDTVLTRKTIRGSIVGTRMDLAECLQFAGDGKVKVHYSTEPLENINSIFARMRDNKIDGRVVLGI